LAVLTGYVPAWCETERVATGPLHELDRSTGSRSRIKCAWLGDRLVTATPEFADVACAAAALGRSERAVLAAANRNFSLIRGNYQLASQDGVRTS
jgi:uncharacterized protein (DUF111 family)